MRLVDGVGLWMQALSAGAVPASLHRKYLLSLGYKPSRMGVASEHP